MYLSETMDGKRVALKVLDKKKEGYHEGRLDMLRKEFIIYQTCNNHPYIARVFNLVENAVEIKQDGSNVSIAYFELELVTEGEIYHHVR